VILDRVRSKRSAADTAWSVDRVCAEYPDEFDWMREFVFVRFVLREPTLAAAPIANRCRGQALSREQMEYIAGRWDDPDPLPEKEGE
jgi:hypothetical protein